MLVSGPLIYKVASVSALVWHFAEKPFAEIAVRIQLCQQQKSKTGAGTQFADRAGASKAWSHRMSDRRTSQHRLDVALAFDLQRTSSLMMMRPNRLRG